MSKVKHGYVWGKSHVADSDDDKKLGWMPLWMHLKDTLETSEHLYERLPMRIRDSLSFDMGLSDDETKVIVAWLAGLHDIGKATPDFSRNKGNSDKEKSADIATERMLSELFGEDEPEGLDLDAIRHETVGFAILDNFLLNYLELKDVAPRTLRVPQKRYRTLITPVSGHHGTYAERCESTLVIQYAKDGMQIPWREVQLEVIDFIGQILPEADEVIRKVASHGVPQRTQLILSAIVVMADWFASSFDDIDIYDVPEPSIERNTARVKQGISTINLPAVFDSSRIPEQSVLSTFESRFGFKPNKMQEAFCKFVDDTEDPADIFVLEAAMGGGKTEAALVAAENLMRRSGASGFFFGLPTMSTTEAIYGRAVGYVERLIEASDSPASLAMMHSKDRISESYNKTKKNIRFNRTNLVDEGSLRRKELRLMNSFAVGTIDQLLMMSLRTKRNFLRHLGLASKVVILDEVHAADDYMLTYLKRSLEWLGFYGVPVILLSATLTDVAAEQLVDAYRTGKKEGSVVTDVSSDA